MTLIEFHFNVADKFSKIAELAQHCLERGQKLAVLCPDSESTEQLYLYLHQQPTLFLPLSWEKQSIDAPIHLTWHIQQMHHDDVLINLQHPQPSAFSCFLKTIELVGTEEQDKTQARERFKFYRHRGYEIRSIDNAPNAT